MNTLNFRNIFWGKLQLNRIITVQECDATMFNRSYEAGYHKKLKVERLKTK